MSDTNEPAVEGEGAEEDFAEAAADAPEVSEHDEPTADVDSYDTEDEDPVEVISSSTLWASSLTSCSGDPVTCIAGGLHPGSPTCTRETHNQELP